MYEANGDAVVVSLRERIPADLAKLDEATKDSLRASLLQQKQQETLQAFMNDMKKRAQDARALTVKADAVPANRG